MSIRKEHMKPVLKDDIIYRTTGLFGTPGRARTVGTYDVLKNGTVRWAVHSVDGGPAPLVDYRLGKALFDGAILDASGAIRLTSGNCLILRGVDRATRLLDAVRSTT